jgi:hypothetical protein
MDSINLSSEYSLVEELENQAEAGLPLNPKIKWAKFVFTDDQRNLNDQLIPQDEFPNIIKTGVNMPIKMEASNPNGEHALATPIGVITNLSKQDNKVIGLAALWKEERPDDIALLEKSYAEKNPLKLSWELSYDDTQSEVDSNGVKVLRGTTVKATTFVGRPAYDGRTNLVALASENKNKEEKQLADNTTDTSTLEAQVAELTSRIKGLEEALQSKDAELGTASTELTSLRDYKATRENLDAKAELTKVRRQALKEAGFDLSDDDFNARAEKIVSMDEDTFGFYLRDMSVFAKKPESSASSSKTIVPDLSNPGSKDPKEIILGGLKQLKQQEK